MLIVPLIQRKRDGGALSADEWTGLISAYVAGRMPDYQMAAMLMAVFLRGLKSSELNAVTDAMLASGGKLAPAGNRPRVDKHSTGGVGDTVSLVLAPLVASCGVDVPMMSGRGLGHTGGTVDKLEAIPGFRTDLTLRQAQAQLRRVGCVLMGQTTEIAPADRKLYALRDVTGTVEAIPLIASSIMSKKLAEGLTGIVLDVKRGAGAFLPEVSQGLELATTMIQLGEARGCPATALVTAMDRPLGRACGNALETAEAIGALRAEGPRDLMEVTYALAAEMLTLAGVATDPHEARPVLERAVASGRAAAKLQEVIEAQGGDARVVDAPGRLPKAPVVKPYCAARSGYVARVDPLTIGWAVVEMGGGRRKVEDRVDPAVGCVMAVEPGDAVERGTPLAFVHARDAAGATRARLALDRAFVLSSDKPERPLPLISHRVTAAGAQPYAG